MELEVDLTAMKPVRVVDELKDEAMSTLITTDAFTTDGIIETSSSPSELSTVNDEVVTESKRSSPAPKTTSKLEDDEDLELTTPELELETTEFIPTTTTHPPYCIPYRDHPTISRCHKGLMAKLSAITEESPQSASVRFPLYNVSIDTLVELCDDFRDAIKCMEGVEKFCKHPLLEFFNQQFISTCTLLKMRDFDVDYACIQKKLIMRSDCLVHINNTVHPAEKCTGHEDFLR
ncbi:hypothetical protein COOONC_21057 [Cooperia oncophora]